MLEVEFISDQYVALILAGDVTVADANAMFTTFDVDGNAVIGVTHLTDSQYLLQFASGVFIGAPWNWTSDGGQSTPPISLPASGEVIFA